MNFLDDIVVCLGDINGHIGRHIHGIDGVHGGMMHVWGIWKE